MWAIYGYRLVELLNIDSCCIEPSQGCHHVSGFGGGGGGAFGPPCQSLACLFKKIDKIEYSTETQHKEYIN